MSDENFTFLNLNISEASWPILIKFFLCSIIGVGERQHKVMGQVDLGTLDSGERSLPFGLLVLILYAFYQLGIASTRNNDEERLFITKINKGHN